MHFRNQTANEHETRSCKTTLNLGYVPSRFVVLFIVKKTTSERRRTACTKRLPER